MNKQKQKQTHKSREQTSTVARGAGGPGFQVQSASRGRKSQHGEHSPWYRDGVVWRPMAATSGVHTA